MYILMSNHFESGMKFLTAWYQILQNSFWLQLITSQNEHPTYAAEWHTVMKHASLLQKTEKFSLLTEFFCLYATSDDAKHLLQMFLCELDGNS